MAALTDFFVAAEDELTDSFPGWVKGGSIGHALIGGKRQPTGLVAQLRRFLRRPDSAAVASIAPPLIERFQHRCEFKGIDLTQLAFLVDVLGIASFDVAIDEIEQPVLLHSYSDDEGLHRLPDSLTQALARLDDSQLGPVAARWSESEDFGESDADAYTNVLTCLRNLSRAAIHEGKHVYHWWSL